MRTIHRNGVVALVAVLAVTFLSSAAASAAPALACGSTLTRDTTLTRDLRCRHGDGLTLVGDVTLNLGGHRLIGPGATEPFPGGRIGVRLSLTGTSTIVNGTIAAWPIGIDSNDDERSATARIRDIRLLGNSIGLHIVRSEASLVRVLVRGNAWGAEGGFSSSFTVRDSTFRNNGTGMTLATMGHLNISRSTFSGHRNVAIGCTEVFCEITGNRITGNGTGVSHWYSGPKVADNYFADNTVAYSAGYNGFNDAEPYGDAVHDNRFVRNDVAVEIEALASAVFRDNEFRENRIGVRGPDGAAAYSVIVAGNTFRRNVDGIYLPPVEVSSGGNARVSVGDNTAVRNRGWGIYAPGATDLGGNVARGNGKSPQCVGVAC